MKNKYKVFKNNAVGMVCLKEKNDYINIFSNHPDKMESK